MYGEGMFSPNSPNLLKERCLEPKVYFEYMLNMFLILLSLLSKIIIITIKKYGRLITGFSSAIATCLS